MIHEYLFVKIYVFLSGVVVATGRLWSGVTTVIMYLSSIFLPRISKKFFTVSSLNKVKIPSSYAPEIHELVHSIKVLIDKRIKPVVQQDGGDVEFIAYYHDTGEVFIRLSGACVGCSQSDITLKRMIQGMLTHYIPEVTTVYNCDKENNIVSGEDTEGY